jgi:hypothetical protein
MNKRIFSMFVALLICITSMMSWHICVKAEGESEDIEFSELMTEDALIGYVENQTWGVYLSSGESIINKISSTKVGAGGVTNATVKCSVSVTAILERKVNGSWVRVTSWTQSNSNAYYAIISKSVTVASGYYYRVRCHHYASTDSATSYTDALWVGN